MSYWHIIAIRDTDFGEVSPIECEDCGTERPTAVYIWNSELNIYLTLCTICFEKMYASLEVMHWMMNTTVTFPEEAQ